MDLTLVVMAAGMGSRFGGLKQVAAVGPNGEAIVDFSVFDAKKAGFSKVVFVIKHSIEKEFKDTVGKRVEKLLPVEYAFQETDMLPEGFSVPAERTKPWGTGHAVLCCKDKVNTPFAVINADDYYGSSAFMKRTTLRAAVRAMRAWSLLMAAGRSFTTINWMSGGQIPCMAPPARLARPGAAPRRWRLSHLP